MMSEKFSTGETLWRCPKCTYKESPYGAERIITCPDCETLPRNECYLCKCTDDLEYVVYGVAKADCIKYVRSGLSERRYHIIVGYETMCGKLCRSCIRLEAIRRIPFYFIGMLILWAILYETYPHAHKLWNGDQPLAGLVAFASMIFLCVLWASTYMFFYAVYGAFTPAKNIAIEVLAKLQATERKNAGFNHIYFKTPKPVRRGKIFLQ